MTTIFCTLYTEVHSINTFSQWLMLNLKQSRIFRTGEGAPTPEEGENLLLPPATKLGQGNIFTPVCHSVHRGGVHGCSRGGMRGCSGGCMVALGGTCVVAPGGCAWLFWGGVWLLPGGHVWLLGGACVVAPGGGMRGCSWGACVVTRGACVVPPGGGMCGIQQDMEIWSMSGRYASYWNAFLFGKIFAENGIKMKEIGPRAVADLGGARDARPRVPNSFIFMQFSAKKRLAHPLLKLAPPSGKS